MCRIVQRAGTLHTLLHNAHCCTLHTPPHCTLVHAARYCSFSVIPFLSMVMANATCPGTNGFDDRLNGYRGATPGPLVDYSWATHGALLNNSSLRGE